MFASSTSTSNGVVPRTLSRVATSIVVVLALTSGGCSSARVPQAQVFSWRLLADTSEPAVQVAAKPPEVEDDGVEVQPPPRRQAQPIPDDPREPFSPNYGRSPLADGRNPDDNYGAAAPAQRERVVSADE
jgi:hypothetical protein